MCNIESSNTKTKNRAKKTEKRIPYSTKGSSIELGTVRETKALFRVGPAEGINFVIKKDSLPNEGNARLIKMDSENPKYVDIGVMSVFLV